MCSSAPVLLANSTATLAANSVSSEPSNASRILLGNTLISFFSALPRGSPRAQTGTELRSGRSLWFLCRLSSQTPISSE